MKFFIAIDSLTCLFLLLSLSPRFVADPVIGDFRKQALHRTGSRREFSGTSFVSLSMIKYQSVPKS